MVLKIFLSISIKLYFTFEVLVNCKFMWKNIFIIFWRHCYRTPIKVASILDSMSQTSQQTRSQSSQWFYAVGKGRQIGVYTSWSECLKQVENITNAKYRKFKTQKEAVAFIQDCQEKYSPYKSPRKSQFIQDPASRQWISSSQPVTSFKDRNLPFSQELSASSSKVMTSPERPNSSPKCHEETVLTRNDSNKLSPQTLSALECLAEQDPFGVEDAEGNSQNRTSGGCSCGNETTSMNNMVRTVEKYFSEIQATMNHIVQKVNDLENKVQEFSCQLIDRNSTAETHNSASLSAKRSLFETYNVPQPLGSRHLSTSRPDNDIEIVPVPPKKIPKIELNSDDEVDGFSHDFKMNENGYVIVYTDGACEKNGRSVAKAGIGVWFGDGHPLNCSEPVHGRATNNTAEIQAAVQAVEIAKRAGVKKIMIRTDSEFLINCVTKWMPKWMRNGWKLSSGGNVKNKEDLTLLHGVMQGTDVKWEHVRGHQGIHGNEMADMLARNGAERYKL